MHLADLGQPHHGTGATLFGRFAQWPVEDAGRHFGAVGGGGIVWGKLIGRRDQPQHLASIQSRTGGHQNGFTRDLPGPFGEQKLASV
ncbi:hypothetical protein D3C76_1708150 [compost metagenome]